MKPLLIRLQLWTLYIVFRLIDLDHFLLETVETGYTWFLDVLGWGRTTQGQIVLVFWFLTRMWIDGAMHFEAVFVAFDVLGLVFLWRTLKGHCSKFGIFSRIWFLTWLAVIVLLLPFPPHRGFIDFVQVVNYLALCWFAYLYADVNVPPRRRFGRLSLSKLKELFGTSWVPQPAEEKV